MTDQVRKAVLLFKDKDPGHGCWDWIIKNHSQLWQQHQAAVRQSNLAVMATTFTAMLTDWKKGDLF